MSDPKWQQLVKTETRFDDGFDENLLREVQEQFQRDSAANSIGTLSPTNTEATAGLSNEYDDFSREDSEEPGEFLQFEEFAGSLEAQSGLKEIELDPSFDETAQEVGGESKESIGSESLRDGPRVLKSKMLLIASLVVSGLLGAGLLTSVWLSSSNRDAAPITAIRRPIPLHFFSDNQEYIFLSSSPHESTLVRLELELTHEGKEAEDALKKGKIELRDLIHRFLADQKPSGNTFAQWQPIVESVLLNTIRKEIPGCNIQELSITNLERI